MQTVVPDKPIGGRGMEEQETQDIISDQAAKFIISQKLLYSKLARGEGRCVRSAGIQA